MTINNLSKQLQTALLLTAMGLLPMACNESAMEQQSATNDTEAQTDWAQTSLSNGTRLSYTATTVVLTNTPSDGAKASAAGEFNYKEVQEVAIYIDREGKNYEEFSRVVDHTDKRNEYDPTRVAERVVRNGQVTAFNNGGKALFTLSTASSGAKGANPDYSMMVKPCSERKAIVMKQIADLARGHNPLGEAGAKGAGSISMEQLSENVVRLSQSFTDTRSGHDEQLTAVSYFNTLYGVPVLSETFNERGELVSRLTQLYKLVDDVPVLAYEENIFFTATHDGQTIENKTITNYENIELQKF